MSLSARIDDEVDFPLVIFYNGAHLLKYIGEMETRFIKETEVFFGNFEGKDVRSGSFTAEHF